MPGDERGNAAIDTELSGGNQKSEAGDDGRQQKRQIYNELKETSADGFAPMGVERQEQRQDGSKENGDQSDDNRVPQSREHARIRPKREIGFEAQRLPQDLAAPDLDE